MTSPSLWRQIVDRSTDNGWKKVLTVCSGGVKNRTYTVFLYHANVRDLLNGDREKLKAWLTQQALSQSLKCRSTYSTTASTEAELARGEVDLRQCRETVVESRDRCRVALECRRRLSATVGETWQLVVLCAFHANRIAIKLYKSSTEQRKSPTRQAI